MKKHKNKSRYILAMGIVAFPGVISEALKSAALECINTYRGDQIIDKPREDALKDLITKEDSVLPF